MLGVLLERESAAAALTAMAGAPLLGLGGVALYLRARGRASRDGWPPLRP